MARLDFTAVLTPRWGAPWFDDPGVSEAVYVSYTTDGEQSTAWAVRWYGSLDGPARKEHQPFEALGTDRYEQTVHMGNFGSLAVAKRAVERAYRQQKR